MSRESRLKAFAATCPSANTSHVNLYECEVCGFLTWSSSYKNDTPGFSVTQLPIDMHCQRCMSVYHRAPEVFDWVLNVIGKLKEKQEEAK